MQCMTDKDAKACHVVHARGESYACPWRKRLKIPECRRGKSTDGQIGSYRP
jgi:hypothetical protein